MLKTEFLGLNYHKPIEGNTDEVDAEEYFNENYFTIDANAKSMREKINYLSKNAPWNTVQGESIHTEDSALWDENKLEISGNMKQEKRSGKNKFKIPESATSNGVTLTKNKDGSFTLNGTTTGVAIFNATLNNPLKTGTYTISYKSSVALGNDFFLRVRDENMILVNSANPASQVIGNNSTHNAATYPASVESAIVAINLTQAGVTYNNVVIYPQLEEGSVETESEQYGAMPSTEFPSMPVVATGVQNIRQFGKNLLNIKNGTYSSNGVTATVSNGKITLNGTATGTSFIAIPFKHKFDNAIVSLSANNETTVGNEDNYAALRIEGDINTMAKFSSKNGNKTFNWNGKIENITIRTGGGLTYNNFVIYPQLEHGQPTPYKPCTEEIHTLDLGTTELCAMTDSNGTVVAQDRPVYRNVDGVWKWQWEKKVGKVILNGTENYVYQNNARFYLKGYFTNENKPDSVATHFPVSNYFISRTMGNTWSGIEGISNDNNGSLNIACNSIATTVEDFKTWLSTHNLTVYYILENTQYIDCTADQSAILDKLYNNFKLNKGVNNIIVETDNGVGVELDLSYMQDNNLKDSYEINEANTGKKWIDGKDIYRKVVEVTDLSNGNNRIAHNINNLNELVDIRGTGNWNGNWQTIPRLVTDAASTFGLGLGDINDTKFLIQVGTAYTNFTKAYIIIEYTKTV